MEDFESMLAPFLDCYGRIVLLPSKNKKKLYALWYIWGKFSFSKDYSEKEANDTINEWTTFRDPATVRRELFNKRLLNRSADCSIYRKENEYKSFEEFISNHI